MQLNPKTLTKTSYTDIYIIHIPSEQCVHIEIYLKLMCSQIIPLSFCIRNTLSINSQANSANDPARSESTQQLPGKVKMI